jgi:serine/threonine-protein kinase
MEYVAGAPLSDKDVRLSLDEALRVFTEVANGLQAMHIAGYVHADLKPNNILLSPEGAVKLIDLGQSAGIHEAKSKIQGTIDYMAPEQVQRGTLDQRTDVFGLGAALHRVVTGKPIATEMNQTVNVHSQSLIGRRVSEIRESTMHHLPTCVARLINDCCQADPGARIADMPALIERIDLARTIVSKRGETTALPDEDASSELAQDSTASSKSTSDTAPATGTVTDADLLNFDEFDLDR